MRNGLCYSSKTITIWATGLMAGFVEWEETMATKTLADVKAEIARLQKQADKMQREALATARKRIEAIEQEAGASLEQLFEDRFKRYDASKTDAAAKPSKRATRAPGTPKYIVGGKNYDGRAARRASAFDAVRVDGKVDDSKALAKRMINPAWLREAPPRILTALGVKDVDAYANKDKL
jgi:DNA-binding protein H-NS